MQVKCRYYYLLRARGEPDRRATVVDCVFFSVGRCMPQQACRRNSARHGASYTRPQREDAHKNVVRVYLAASFCCRGDVYHSPCWQSGKGSMSIVVGWLVCAGAVCDAAVVTDGSAKNMLGNFLRDDVGRWCWRDGGTRERRTKRLSAWVKAVILSIRQHPYMNSGIRALGVFGYRHIRPLQRGLTEAPSHRVCTASLFVFFGHTRRSIL